MVNIRDQCSWVHAHEKDEATRKAKDLVRMAVAKARCIESLKEPIIDVMPKGLIIGGGLAGMTVALSLADQGFPCVLLERSGELGGNLRNIHYTLEGADPRSHLEQLVNRVRSHEFITVRVHAEIESVSGFVGNFKTVIAEDRKRRKRERSWSMVSSFWPPALPHSGRTNICSASTRMWCCSMSWKGAWPPANFCPRILILLP
jgi:heterodisulfide reductase subunit A